MSEITAHQCLFRGCTATPTRSIESDVGLEGTLLLYFCEEHEAAFRRGAAGSETLQLDVERSEPENASRPET